MPCALAMEAQHFNFALKYQENKRRENKRGRGNKQKKTNVFTFITLANKQRNREENFRILELVAEKKT